MQEFLQQLSNDPLWKSLISSPSSVQKISNVETGSSVSSGSHVQLLTIFLYLDRMKQIVKVIVILNLRVNQHFICILVQVNSSWSRTLINLRFLQLLMIVLYLAMNYSTDLLGVAGFQNRQSRRHHFYSRKW